MDLDDLLDDNLTSTTKVKKQISQPKPNASIDRGSAGSRSRLQQIDDDDDIFNLDDKKPTLSNKNNSVKGASGTQSKVAALWGGNAHGASNSKINTSFGASNKGSGAGSRKSRLEEEADELDDMLNQIDGGPKANDPIPTGTFRNDGWDDL